MSTSIGCDDISSLEVATSVDDIESNFFLFTEFMG
jgi:hypothetical protein